MVGYSLYLMHHNDDFSSTEPSGTNWNTWQDIVFLVFETLLFKKIFAQYWEYFRNRTAASSSINLLFLFLKSRIFSTQNKTNTNAADDLVLCVAMPSAAIVLTKRMNLSLVLHREGFQLPMSSTFIRIASKCCIHVQIFIAPHKKLRY